MDQLKLRTAQISFEQSELKRQIEFGVSNFIWWYTKYFQW